MLSTTLRASALPMRDAWMPGLAQVWLDDPSSVQRLGGRGLFMAAER
jgi:hypothetical protein